MYREIERGFRLFHKLVEMVLIAGILLTADAIRFVGAKLLRRDDYCRDGESK